MTRRWSSLGFGAFGALAVVAVVALGPAVEAQPASEGTQLLAAARSAASHASYAGVVVVRWHDAAGQHESRDEALVDHGVVAMSGEDQQVVSIDGQRWVGFPGSWDLVLGPSAGGVGPPRLDANWTLRVTPGPAVAGRPTSVVSADDPTSGATRARFYVDVDTHTLLRQDILDPNGQLLRETSFDVLVPLPVPPPAPAPSGATSHQPTTLPAVPSGYQDPTTIGRGYRLIGRYRQPDGTIQLYYSDGLFTLSLFEQRGSVDWDALPAGTSGQVQGVDLRTYTGATTSAVVWGSHGLVITCVADGPADQAMLAVRDVIGGGNGTGFLGQLGHFILSPFGWD